jgi:hypothetical protein
MASALVRHRFSVGAVTGHGVVGVCNSDDAGAKRDVVTSDAVRVAAAVGQEQLMPNSPVSRDMSVMSTKPSGYSGAMS